MADSKATIGELNGWWSYLLKLTLVAFPVFTVATLGWGTWATTEIMAGKYFREFGARFTNEMAGELEDKIDARNAALTDKINALNQQNARILTEIEYLKKRVTQ